MLESDNTRSRTFLPARWLAACLATTTTVVFLQGCDLSPDTSSPPPEPLDFVATVTVVGQGTVTSEPPGIDCGMRCSASLRAVSVKLAPTPMAGQRFYGWSGDPDCSEGVLSLAGSRQCTAHFVPVPALATPGSGWSLLASPLTVSSDVDPAAVIARDGANAVAAFIEAVAGDVPRLYVKRQEGDAWVTLGGTALNAGRQTAASEPALATTPFGQPYVAWIQGNGVQQNLFVARFNGTAWESVGEPGVPLNYRVPSVASSPSLAIDHANLPVVAWIEDGAVKVKKFDGAWRPVVSAPTFLGSQGPESSAADAVRLVLDGSILRLVFREQVGAEHRLSISSPNGSATADGFTRVGDGPLPVAGGMPPTFAISADGIPSQSGLSSIAVVADTGASPVTLAALSPAPGWPPFLGQGPLLIAHPGRLAALDVDVVLNAYGFAFSLADDANGTTQTIVKVVDVGPRAWRIVGPPLLGSVQPQQRQHISLDVVDGLSPRLAVSFRTSAAGLPPRFEARVWRFYP